MFMQTSRKKFTDINMYPAWVKQAFKFLVVGVLNTGIDLAVYFLLTRWVPFFVDQKVFAKGISYSLGILNSFFWNRSWTFKSQSEQQFKVFVLFIITNLAGLAVNTFTMQIGLSMLHLPDWLALGLATASTLLWNFLISKFVVFRE